MSQPMTAGDRAALVARVERLTKFKADYFATAPGDISQLVADGMIVVIDLEAERRDLLADHARLQEELAEYKIITATAEQAEMRYLKDCVAAEAEVKSLRAELTEEQAAYRLMKFLRDGAERKVQAMEGYVQHLPNCPALPANADRFTKSSASWRQCACGLDSLLTGQPAKGKA